MGENVAILFIFFMILVVALVFYARLTETKVEVKKEEAFSTKALEVAQRIAYIPETQCSVDNAVEEDCYDLHKLRALEEVNKKVENKAHYYQMFGWANITINQIFPESDWHSNIYNNIPEKYVEKQAVFIPLSICDFSSRPEKCSFAVMTVEVFR